ncbi:DUF5763 domain-containing protein [Flaviaesturariibacter aridisoli]|uniref:Uncharacterized protein n=1 Tax=Flaviaesturariibacter aridisoli TaxID=2545761 RepID=A0A4R4E7V2_9BACT|nr:DUF5763 domain-containing protein [Flaviaesturariibacter aridisoli]TCZ74910.1 hypothetical protein E0486_00985 [Flaviaesturariibacter aridisoli]
MHLLFLFFLAFLHPPQDRSVYVCTGPKAYAYHFSASCRGLNRCSTAIIEEAVSKAVADRRRPCQLCAGSAVVPVRAEVAPASDGQCRGTTLKGARCRRRAGAGGYCYQHG